MQWTLHLGISPCTKAQGFSVKPFAKLDSGKGTLFNFEMFAMAWYPTTRVPFSETFNSSAFSLESLLVALAGVVNQRILVG